MQISKDVPEHILKVIAKNCPTALGTYLHVIHHQNNFKYANFCKCQVERKFKTSWRKFRNDVSKLVLFRLLKWHPCDDGIAVTVVN